MDLTLLTKHYFKMKNLVVLFFLPYTFFAQKAIIIPIETENNALVLCTDKDNHLNTYCFGKKLYQSNDYAGIEAQYNLKDESGLYNSVYTSSGSSNLMESALTLTHSDGNTSTELKYVSHSVAKKTDDITVTSILLRDEIYPIEVTLYYETYNKENVIVQWSEIKNNETGTIELKNMLRRTCISVQAIIFSRIITEFEDGK